MINYFIEDTHLAFRKRRDCNNWIKSAIIEESKDVPRRAGDISIIFCSDEYLLNINTKFLSHNYFTDVITFDNSESNLVSGDIFISIDSVRSNSEYYKQEFLQELHRVIIHGVLHLLGYDDKTKPEKDRMKQKEDYYLKKKNLNDR